MLVEYKRKKNAQVFLFSVRLPLVLEILYSGKYTQENILGSIHSFSITITRLSKGAHFLIGWLHPGGNKSSPTVPRAACALHPPDEKDRSSMLSFTSRAFGEERNWLPINRQLERPMSTQLINFEAALSM